LKQARRNQDDVSLRANSRNHSTKKSNLLLFASRGCPSKRESVGLHSTLEQEIRDYMADPRQARRNVLGGQGGFQVVPMGISGGYDAVAALHRTGGIADGHYLQLADQMLKQGKYKKPFAQRAPDAWQILHSIQMN
jgi:hypothetical protein